MIRLGLGLCQGESLRLKKFKAGSQGLELQGGWQ